MILPQETIQADSGKSKNAENANAMCNTGNASIISSTSSSFYVIDTNRFTFPLKLSHITLHVTIVYYIYVLYYTDNITQFTQSID